MTLFWIWFRRMRTSSLFYFSVYTCDYIILHMNTLKCDGTIWYTCTYIHAPAMVLFLYTFVILYAFNYYIIYLLVKVHSIIYMQFCAYLYEYACFLVCKKAEMKWLLRYTKRDKKLSFRIWFLTCFNKSS